LSASTLIRKYLLKLEMPFFVIIPIASNRKSSIADSALIGLVPRVLTDVSEHCGPLVSIESTALSVLANCAVVLGRSLQMNRFYVELKPLLARV
jgi:hypothetical protein